MGPQVSMLPAGTDSAVVRSPTDLPCIINPVGVEESGASGSGHSKQKLRMNKLRSFFRKIFD